LSFQLIIKVNSISTNGKFTHILLKSCNSCAIFFQKDAAMSGKQVADCCQEQHGHDGWWLGGMGNGYSG